MQFLSGQIQENILTIKDLRRKQGENKREKKAKKNELNEVLKEIVGLKGGIIDKENELHSFNCKRA